MQARSIALATGAVATALVFGLTIGVAGAAEQGPGGNSAAAKACQGQGYLDWVREDGSSFTTPGACVSYAARGGTLEPKRTWETVCTDELGGIFNTEVDPPPFNTITWVCTWMDISFTQLQVFDQTLQRLCPASQGQAWEPGGRAVVFCRTGLPA